MKKITSLLLVLVMALSVVLVSCNSSDDTSGDAGEVSATNNAFVPHLGETDKYAGKSLKMLCSSGNKKEDFPAFVKEAFWADELTEEPVNDAVYERNQALKAAYGIELDIEWEAGFTTYLDRVRADKSAGTAEYDVMVTGIQTLGTLAAEGHLLDLYTIEDEVNNLNFEGEWWDKAAIEDCSIANKLYFVTGDIVMMDDEHTRCVVYNMDILENANLEKPSVLVDNDEWTLDKFAEMGKAAAQIGSDGTWNHTSDCVYGSVMAAFDTYTLVVAHDCPQVEKDSDDIPVLSMMNDKNFAAFTHVYDKIINSSELVYTEKFTTWSDTSVIQKFADGKALFYVTTVGTINGASMRESSVSYGVLPVPKGDIEQEGYASPTNPYWFTCVAINKTASELDFVTFALESLAYSAREYITPQYYEVTLQSKRALDDPDSYRMLDVLFQNRLVDISVVFNWDDCIQYYNQCLTTGRDGLASLIESHEGAFNSAMEKTLENFK